MNQRIREGIAEAARLTRAGKLKEATALIQRTLRGSAPQADHHSVRDGDEAIEGSCSVVEKTPLVTDVSANKASGFKDGTGAASMRAWSTAAPSSVRAAPASFDAPNIPVDVDEAASEPLVVTATDTATAQAKWPERLRRLFRISRGGSDSPRIARESQQPYTTDIAERGTKQTDAHIARKSRQPHTCAGQFIDGSFTNHAGTRAYKLYIPTGYHGQALPLVVMLHGCTQNPDDAAAGTQLNALADQESFLVVYPAQPASANQNKCWNWFSVRDQQRDRGEPSIIAGITSEVVSKYGLDARRVYVAGMSAGGAMAAVMGAEYPDLYAAVGVHSGLAHGAARDMQSAFAAMRSGAASARTPASLSLNPETRHRVTVPTIVFHGDRDNTVHPRNGDQVLEQALNGGASAGSAAQPRVTLSQGQVPNGRAYTRSVYHDASGQTIMERWLVHGAGHAWSGGSATGSYTDPRGPDASREMVNFFYRHAKGESVLKVDATSAALDNV